MVNLITEKQLNEIESLINEELREEIGSPSILTEEQEVDRKDSEMLAGCLEEIESKNNEARNASSGNKPEYALIPKLAIDELAKAFTYGAVKYGKFNYAKGAGINISELLSKSLRHIYQFIYTETHDKESKELHLGHAMAGLAMAVHNYYEKYNNTMDCPTKIEIEE